MIKQHGLKFFAAIVIGAYLLHASTVRTEVVQCQFKEMFDFSRYRKTYRGMSVAVCWNEKLGFVEANFKSHGDVPKRDEMMELQITKSWLGTNYEVFVPSI